jgi:hypothetical protein
MDFFAIWIFCIFCPGSILTVFLIMYAFHDQYKRLNDIDKDKDFK